jgi:protein-S-isoprenylcysteine O-methyltransferase Ste14
MGIEEPVEAAASALDESPAIAVAEPPSKAPEPEVELSRAARFRHALGNIGLALLFFTALIPAKGQYNSGLANDIWLGGAVLMGLLSLVRIPARSSMINLQSILATAAMMTIPALMRPGAATSGLLQDLAIVIELIGIAFTQVSRLYLGRRFGLLPANRGIVSKGPFRLVRHPVYSGWLVLTIGFLMAYPTPRNVGILILSLPFLVWRMELEEEHLNEDAEYREYAAKTPCRLIPWVY